MQAPSSASPCLHWVRPLGHGAQLFWIISSISLCTPFPPFSSSQRPSVAPGGWRSTGKSSCMSSRIVLNTEPPPPPLSWLLLLQFLHFTPPSSPSPPEWCLSSSLASLAASETLPRPLASHSPRFRLQLPPTAPPDPSLNSLSDAFQFSRSSGIKCISDLDLRASLDIMNNEGDSICSPHTSQNIKLCISTSLCPLPRDVSKGEQA